MKKALIAVLVLIVVVGILLWRVYANLDVIVAGAIEDVGTRVSGTSVHVDGVELQLLDGKAAISGLNIANPPGFSGPDIFRLGQIAVAIDIESLKEGPIVIDRLQVSQPQVFMEMNEENRSNLDVLRKNVQSYTGTTTSPTGEEQPAEAAGEPVKLIIRKLVFEGGSLSASSALAGKSASVELPGFEMSGLGSAGGGATAAQLAQEILDRLIRQAAQAASKAGLDVARQKLEEKAKQQLDDKFGDKLKGVLSQ